MLRLAFLQSADLHTRSLAVTGYTRVFEILRGVHYNGFCSLVYEGKEDEQTAIPRAAKYLRKMVRGD